MLVIVKEGEGSRCDPSVFLAWFRSRPSTHDKAPTGMPKLAYALQVGTERPMTLPLAGAFPPGRHLGESVPHASPCCEFVCGPSGLSSAWEG